MVSGMAAATAAAVAAVASAASAIAMAAVAANQSGWSGRRMAHGGVGASKAGRWWLVHVMCNIVTCHDATRVACRTGWPLHAPIAEHELAVVLGGQAAAVAAGSDVSDGGGGGGDDREGGGGVFGDGGSGGGSAPRLTCCRRTFLYILAVHQIPPSAGALSMTVTLCPAARSLAAEVRPEIPPPKITAVFLAMRSAVGVPYFPGRPGSDCFSKLCSPAKHGCHSNVR